MQQHQRRATFDWERFAPFYAAALAQTEPRGTVSDLVRAWVERQQCGYYEERIPVGPSDTITTDMALRPGRADIVVFHVDGSASVIEAKDGAKGYGHVVAGIGQSGKHAVQLAVAPVALRLVRRCLLWSSTGDLLLDAMIEHVCEGAGVVPLPLVSMRELVACRIATRNMLNARSAEGA